MRKTFAIAALTAAALSISACKEEKSDNTANTTETTQKAEDRPSLSSVKAPEIDLDEYRENMRAAVTIKSVTPAYDIPSLAAELKAAQQIAGDDLDNDGFLSITHTVKTRHGMVREVDTIAFCNEHIDERNYNDKCADTIGWKLAATNSAYSGLLETYVPTDNATLRETARVDFRWLRTAMDNRGSNDSLYFVRDIRNVQNTTGLTADGYIPAPEGEEVFEDKKERILKAVALNSVSPAMDDPDTYVDLMKAQRTVGDDIDNSGFLNFSFQLATQNGELRHLDVLAYCEDFIGETDYVEKCSDNIKMRLAVNNSTTQSPLEVTVVTDNPVLRPNALVSVEWLRRALDFDQNVNYHIVRDITTLEGPKP